MRYRAPYGVCGIKLWWRMQSATPLHGLARVEGLCYAQKCMKILNFEAPFLVKGLQYHGHQVLSVGTFAACDVRVKHPVPALEVYQQAVDSGFTPDAAFFCDGGNLPCFPGMEALPCPSLFYSIDTYCNTWHINYAFGFDAVCVAQKDHVGLFSHEGLQAHWLPLFAKHGQDVCAEKDFSARDIPVAFVGTLNPNNIPDRKPFLEDFKRRHPLLFLSGDYVPVFNRARIVLNQTAFSELNFRCFEAMACGAALLMEHSPHGLTDFFTPGEHILPLYRRGDATLAAALAQKALQNPGALAALAKRGHDEVQARHLDIHRAQRVLTLLEDLVRNEAAKTRLNDLARRRTLLSVAYGMLADGLTDPALRRHAQYFMTKAGESLEAGEA